MALKTDTRNALRSALGLNAAKEVIDDLNVVDSLAGGPLTAVVGEINNKCDGQPALCTIAAAAGSSNICNVTFTLKDGNGVAITGPTTALVYLSDAASGYGLTATAASGTVQAKSASGTDLTVVSAKKAINVMCKADGTYILEITDSSKTGFYPCILIPGQKVIVGTQLVTGNYG